MFFFTKASIVKYLTKRLPYINRIITISYPNGSTSIEKSAEEVFDEQTIVRFVNTSDKSYRGYKVTIE